MAKNKADTPIEAAEYEVVIADFVPSEDDINKVVRWSSRESMVSISLGSIGTHNFAKAAYKKDTSHSSPDEIIGYGAITHIYSGDILELGGLVVSEQARGMGVAKALIKAITKSAVEAMNPDILIAFSNPKSSSIFSKLGGIQVPEAQALPPEVWKVCHTCRFYDDALACGDRCCGRVYDITAIETDS